MRIQLSILTLFILLCSCTVAQPGRYNTESKKAIKLYEEANSCFKVIDPMTGRRSALDCAEKCIGKRQV
ncbi:MAG: hypothetical protein JKY54_14900 [Flavobacteriales bacterium]|nr:hypothetical protein [Flavobacteriales bacterium]